MWFFLGALVFLLRFFTTAPTRTVRARQGWQDNRFPRRVHDQPERPRGSRRLAQVIAAGEAVAGPQTFDIIQADETDTAEALSFTKTIFVALTPADETDAAVAVTLYKAVNLSSAAETDEAPAFADIDKQVTLVQADETDTAEAVTFTQAGGFDLVQADETDSAPALVANKTLGITRADETDTAQPLDADKQVVITTTAEADTAPVLDVDKSVTIVQGAETDSAQALTFTQTHFRDLVPATETDEAPAQSFSGGAVAASGPERIRIYRPLKFPDVETIP